MDGTTYSLADARNNLSKLVEEVQTTGERATITRHGKAVAYVLTMDDYEGLVLTCQLLAQSQGEPTQAEVAKGIALVSNETLVAELLQRLGKSRP